MAFKHTNQNAEQKWTEHAMMDAFLIFLFVLRISVRVSDDLKSEQL